MHSYHFLGVNLIWRVVWSISFPLFLELLEFCAILTFKEGGK